MDGVSMQTALLNAEIVTDLDYTNYLRLGDKLIKLGHDSEFNNALLFAIKRNAKAFQDNQSNLAKPLADEVRALTETEIQEKIMRDSRTQNEMIRKARGEK